MKKVYDVTALKFENDDLFHYIQHNFIMREVMKKRMLWDDDRQTNINNVIAKAMKQWDNEHYPHMLKTT